MYVAIVRTHNFLVADLKQKKPCRCRGCSHQHCPIGSHSALCSEEEVLMDGGPLPQEKVPGQPVSKGLEVEGQLAALQNLSFLPSCGREL